MISYFFRCTANLIKIQILIIICVYIKQFIFFAIDFSLNSCCLSRFTIHQCFKNNIVNIVLLIKRRIFIYCYKDILIKHRVPAYNITIFIPDFFVKLVKIFLFFVQFRNRTKPHRLFHGIFSIVKYFFWQIQKVIFIDCDFLHIKHIDFIRIIRNHIRINIKFVASPF